MYASKDAKKLQILFQGFLSFTNYLLNSFILKFCNANSCIKLANYSSRPVCIKADTVIGCVCFDILHNLSSHENIITHFHTDCDGMKTFCNYDKHNCAKASLAAYSQGDLFSSCKKSNYNILYLNVG